MAATFPRTITDGANRAVVFEQAPKTVVSMAPATTEIVRAIGAQEQLAGVTRYCHGLGGLDAVPDVGGAYDPNYEKIVALRPALVIVSNMADGRFVEQYERLGLKTLVLNKEGLRSVMDDILLVGDVLERQDAAAAVVGRLQNAMKGRAATLSARKSSVALPKTLLLYGGGGNLLSAGKGSFIGEVLAVAGGQNIADAARVPWPQLSREYVLQSNPDIIFCVDEGMPGLPPRKDAERIAQWRKDPVFSRLNAVKNEQVWRLDAGLFNYPGPRLDSALAQLSEVIDGYFSAEGFSGISNEAATDKPSKSATTPSDTSIGM